MVFRRPYAFLIKHFRLIHLFISAIFTYIVILSRNIYKYLSSVISDSVNRYNALEYINYGIYLYIFLALILCFVVYWLLKYKNKPRRIYILTFVGYIIISIFMFLLFNYMREFSNAVIGQKTIRFYRDSLLIILFFQYYIIIFMFVRGLGFDIRKFNFGKDVQELNATLEDSEEVEVNAKIDTTNVVRGFRRQKREFGYFYKEYKIYIIIIIVLVLSFIGYNAYGYFSVKYKVYNENENIGNLYNITIRDSYYNIGEDNNFVIINFDVRKNGKKGILNISNMILTIGKDKYIPDKNICYQFNRMGNCYKKQYIGNNIDNYIVVYNIHDLNIQDAYLLYNESYDKSYKVKLIMKQYQE